MAIAKGLSFYCNGYSLACALKEFTPEVMVDVLDSTTLCQTSRTYVQGAKAGLLSSSGVWDYDNTNNDKIHNVFSSAFNAGTDNIITASLETLAVGGKAVLFNAVETKHSIQTPLNQLIMVSADFTANAIQDFGIWLFSNSVASTTTNGTGQDNSAASSNGGVLHVHYQASSATGGTVILQHSTDNSTFADLATITLSGSYDADYAVIAAGTTVNRYVRARVTATGGTATFQVAFARR